MKGKIALLVGGAAGYVLGTRAGHDRYEQIKTQAQSLWRNPKVQEKTGQAQSFAQDKAGQAQSFAQDKAPGMQQTVADAAGPGSAKGTHEGNDSAPGGAEPGRPGE